jgi:hypothetical protein
VSHLKAFFVHVMDVFLRDIILSHILVDLLEKGVNNSWSEGGKTIKVYGC